MIRARHARLDLRGPAWIAVAVIPLNLVLDWLLLPKFGTPAAGWATTASCWVQLILLSRGMKSLGIESCFSLKRLPRLLLPSLGVVLSVGGLTLLAGSHDQLPSWALVLIGVSLGAGVFAFILRAVLPVEWNAIVPNSWKR